MALKYILSKVGRMTRIFPYAELPKVRTMNIRKRCKMLSQHTDGGWSFGGLDDFQLN